MMKSFGDVIYVSLLIQLQINGVQQMLLWFFDLSPIPIWVNNGKLKY